MQQPLLIVGMHRSGTSMMTRILTHQGIFLGHKRQGDDEALHFLNLNIWMMGLAGVDWDHPLPAAELMSRSEDVDHIARIVRTRLKAPYTFSYLGSRFIKTRGRIDTQLPFDWGFKDPRSSITLPVWMNIFPGARILRMKRHGMDVAASLKTRFDQLRREQVGQYQLGARLGATMPKRNRVVDHIRCDTVDGGLAIWDEYETTLDGWLTTLPDDQQLTIRYEDYVRDPAGHHQEISQFLGRNVTGGLPDGIKPDPSRAEAWRSKTELAPIAKANEELLARNGYTA